VSLDNACVSQETCDSDNAPSLDISAFRFFIECRTSGHQGDESPVALGEGSKSAVTRRSSVVSADIPGESVSNFDAEHLNKVSPRALIAKEVTKARSSLLGSIPLPANRLHALIVEDNIINQTVLKRQLTTSGFTCGGEL
jgi:hypothetical protein